MVIAPGVLSPQYDEVAAYVFLSLYRPQFTRVGRFRRALTGTTLFGVSFWRSQI